MSFKKDKNKSLESKIWLKNNRATLVEIGIPLNIIESEKHWFYFIEHGYDFATLWDYKEMQNHNVKKFITLLENQETTDEYQSLIIQLSNNS